MNFKTDDSERTREHFSAWFGCRRALRSWKVCDWGKEVLVVQKRNQR